MVSLEKRKENHFARCFSGEYILPNIHRCLFVSLKGVHEGLFGQSCTTHSKGNSAKSYSQHHLVPFGAR